MKYKIGIDIGGTKCAVILGSYEKGAGGSSITLLQKKIFDTKKTGGPKEMIALFIQTVEEMLQEHAIHRKDLEGIGISCGGPLSSKERVIIAPPNLPGWVNVPIGSILEEHFGIPVMLENDANACAMAEWKFGAGVGCRNMIFLTFGTGMGAGLILNGQLYSGTNDMAGEIGHVRLAEYGPVGYGKKGSFEGFCSGGGLAQIGQTIAREIIQGGGEASFCKKLSDLDTITAKTIAECANEGNEDALEVYRICGEMLGRGLAILIDVLNPERIVLGSVYQRSGHLLAEAMQKVLEKECLSLARRVCEVVPAKLEENIGDYAALAVGMSED